MPPASGSNSATNAAAVQAKAAEREEKLRGALKSFILKERQRKKEGKIIVLKLTGFVFNLIFIYAFFIALGIQKSSRQN